MKRAFQEGEEDPSKRVRTEGQPNRTIYFGSLHPATTIAEICDFVSGGNLESVRVLNQKNCAFVTFVEMDAAVAFHEECSKNPPVVHGRKLHVGWGSSKPIAPDVQEAVQNGASRNVFFGGLPAERMHEAWLRSVLAPFGAIDCVDVLLQKKIVFVHFATIQSAIKVVQTLAMEPQWQSVRVNFGKDRCTSTGKKRTHSGLGSLDLSWGQSLGPLGGPLAAPLGSISLPRAPEANDFGNRTVYLGGSVDDITPKDVCDQVWGGALESVKVLPDKKCAFVTFLDSRAAAFFAARAQSNRGEFSVKGKIFKVGWGKARPMHPEIQQGVQQGATRNVFLGNIDDNLTAQQIADDLSTFGPIEKINIVGDKKIAFVNFTSILHAIHCVKELRNESSRLHQSGYGKFRVNYGKDRCARTDPPVIRNRQDQAPFGQHENDISYS